MTENNDNTAVAVQAQPAVCFEAVILDNKEPVRLTAELIRKMSKPLTDLVITDLFDYKGFELVKKAKAKAVKTRTTIEKLQKSHLDDLKSAYENKKKEITDYTADLYAACREAENMLQGKLTAHEEAKAAAQKKLEEERLGKTTAREARMYELGMVWNGQNFVGYAKFIGKDFLFGLSDESYDGLVSELAGLQMQAGIAGQQPEPVAQVSPMFHGGGNSAASPEKPWQPFTDVIYQTAIATQCGKIYFFITTGAKECDDLRLIENDEINGSGYFVQVITR